MSDALLALSTDSLGDELMKILELRLKIEEAEKIGGPTSDLERHLYIHEEMAEKNLERMKKIISDYRNLGTENALESADRAEKAIEGQFEFVASQRDFVRSEIRKTHWHTLAKRAKRAEIPEPLRLLTDDQELCIKK